MIHTKMAEDLKALGLTKSDTVLMHSSLSSLGYVEGGADTVIDTLLSVLSEGTLLLPALSYRTVRTETPVFSQSETPSCVGLISETFRKREGVLRSLHPTHSVAGIGKYAKEILAEHANDDTPVGPSSPFSLLPKYNGKILMLGCGLTPNTSMHGVEELERPRYLMKDEKTTFTLIDAEGRKTQKAYECHNFKGFYQRYERLEGIMEITRGKVLKADCCVLDAKTVWKVGHEALKKDKDYFIEEYELS